MNDIVTIGGVDLYERPKGVVLPPQAFTSREIYDAELPGLFERSWVHVADLHELKDPGDFVTADIGRVPVVIVRSHDGEIRGFLNVCRHRGATLAEGTGNCGKQLKCPYHAWSYQTDGKLVGVPFKDEFDCDFDEMNLIPMRIARTGPLVFGCLDESAPEFVAWAGDLVPTLERHLGETYQHSFTFDYEIDCNWKIYVENGLEGYHIGFVHDMLDQFTPNRREATHVFEEHASHTHTDIAEMFRTMMPPPAHLSEKEAGQVRFGFIFPNLVPVITPRDLSYLRISPAGPDKIRLRGRSFDHGDLPEELVEFRKQSFDMTNSQDISVVTRVQKGVQAGRVKNFVHSNALECRIGHFERIWARELSTYLQQQQRHLPVSSAAAE